MELSLWANHPKDSTLPHEGRQTPSVITVKTNWYLARGGSGINLNRLTLLTLPSLKDQIPGILTITGVTL